jgi:hypothetical protein
MDLCPLQKSIEVGWAASKVQFAYFLEEAVDENGGVRVLVAVDAYIGILHFWMVHRKTSFLFVIKFSKSKNNLLSS